MQIIRPIPITDTGAFTRATIATYTNELGFVATAASDEPRFSYNPQYLTDGPSFLKEVAATNLAIYASQFEHTSWNKTRCSISPNSIVSPDGTASADKLVSDVTVNQLHTLFRPHVVTAGAVCNASIYIRGAEFTRFFRLYVDAVGGAAVYADFDMQTLTTTLSSSLGGTYTAGSVVDVGGEWFRCEFTFALPGATDYYFHPTLRDNSGEVVFNGDGVSGMYIWGAQLTVGAGVSSFIPTVATPVLRAADVCGMLVSNVPETDYSAWSGATRYIAGNRVMDSASHVVYEAANGAAGVAAFNSAGTGHVVVTSNGQIYTPALSTQVVFATTGSLPAGIVAGTVYYVLAFIADGFSVAAAPGGTAIDVSGANSGVHTATVSNNINIPLTDRKYWLDAGSNNRYRMFDQSVTSQTAQASRINVAILPGARFDSIVGLNVSASEVTINVVDPLAGNVYSKRINMTLTSDITDWYAYFYAPIVRATEFIVSDILAVYANATITVSLSAGGTAAIGGLIVGLSKEIGDTEWGVKVGIVDYGVKRRDGFGNYVIVERNFSKRADFTIYVPTKEVDTLHTLLSSYRAIPVVYVGSNAGADQQFSSTIIYGFYKDFSIDIAYPAFSVCTMQVEGLT